MENGGDALVSKNEILWDIMFHHQSKQDALHAFLIDGTGNARPPQTCSFPWICLLREFPCWQAPQLPPNAIPSRNQL
jgi:hypothetical protein